MKELLEQLAKGEQTVDDVLAKIDESDKEKVPRSRLNDKIDDIKELQSQLKERDDQLESLGKKAKDSEELTKEIDALKETNATQATEYENKLQEQAFNAKLADALRDAKVRNPKAVKALLDSDSIKLDGDKLLGLDGQLEALKESDAYLFEAEEDKGVLGGRKPNGSKDTSATGMTKEDFAKLSYVERSDLFASDPETYKKLTT